jgi:large subunit ribosomal protein L15
MKIQDLSPAKGSIKKAKRVGRGPGSRHGKTSTRGHKGQKSRSGGTKGPMFEGGQTALQRRLPKRGFKNIPFKKEYAIINLKDIERFQDAAEITPLFLIQKKVLKDIKDGLKVLGVGNINKPLTVKAHAFSSSAVSKIQASGGKIEVLKS